jgi:hypothetical protein
VPVPVREGPKPWLEVIERFRDGELTAAFSLSEECGSKGFSQCRTLNKQISQFSDDLKKVEKMTPKELGELLDLDEKITGGPRSKSAKGAAVKLANFHYKNASQAKAAGDYARAMDLAVKALAADPSHAAAQALKTDMRSKSKDVYQQGYTMKDSDPDEARRLFNEVVKMTSPDDEFHQKAKNWLRKLQE